MHGTLPPLPTEPEWVDLGPRYTFAQTFILPPLVSAGIALLLCSPVLAVTAFFGAWKIALAAYAMTTIAITACFYLPEDLPKKRVLVWRHR